MVYEVGAPGEDVVGEEVFASLLEPNRSTGEPADAVDHGEHRSGVWRSVRHTGVPHAHISNEDAAGADGWLERRRLERSLSLALGRDLDVAILHGHGGIGVGSGPDFGAAVLGGHID